MITAEVQASRTILKICWKLSFKYLDIKRKAIEIEKPEGMKSLKRAEALEIKINFLEWRLRAEKLFNFLELLGFLKIEQLETAINTLFF